MEFGMPEAAEFALIRQRYRDVLGASVSPAFSSYIHRGASPENGAALGYRRAGVGRLFLENYLSVPVEEATSAALGRKIERQQIVEIGNFASNNAVAMIELWGEAANDLARGNEVAVATLTEPLRRMFERIGLQILVLAPARAECLGSDAHQWGGYYDLNPQVCAGMIAEGQRAISAFLQRRCRREVA
jgi:hypothetical protein